MLSDWCPESIDLPDKTNIRNCKRLGEKKSKNYSSCPITNCFKIYEDCPIYKIHHSQ